jgi:hypothetical protein
MEDAGTRARSRPTTPADLHRLAARAQERGLRLTQERPGVWFCSSASRPELHYVTGLSCDCRGFIEHQRCTHHARLLDHLGWLPEIEDGSAPCLWCFGSGRTPNDDTGQYDRCHPCEGTGRLPVLQDALAA